MLLLENSKSGGKQYVERSGVLEYDGNWDNME